MSPYARPTNAPTDALRTPYALCCPHTPLYPRGVRTPPGVRTGGRTPEVIEAYPMASPFFSPRPCPLSRNCRAQTKPHALDFSRV
jgi:hypothetical protein